MRFEIRAAAAASFALLSLLALGTRSGEAATMVLDRCTDVPPGVTAVLEDDLVCGYHCAADPSTACDPADGTACPGQDDFCEPDVVGLGNRSRLRLNGFTIYPGYQGDGVVCGEWGERGVCSVAASTYATSWSGRAASTPAARCAARTS